MKNLLFTLALAITTISCDSNRDPVQNSEIRKFEGKYSGTLRSDYDSQDFGVWSFDVNDSGVISNGAFIDQKHVQTVQISGNVDKYGKVKAILGNSGDYGTFTGEISNTQTSGQWGKGKPVSSTGTWKGTKK